MEKKKKILICSKFLIYACGVIGNLFESIYISLHMLSISVFVSVQIYFMFSQICLEVSISLKMHRWLLGGNCTYKMFMDAYLCTDIM